MQLQPLDLAVIGVYLVIVIGLGWLFSRRAGKDLNAYFLGGKSIPWYILGVSHGTAGFDISGTMWFVLMLTTYGVKGVWILWMWPMFAMVFRMMYLGVWIRRSNVLTGAEWMRTRFSDGVGGNLAHLSVVLFALISVIGFLSMAFKGVGKFAQPFFPFEWSPDQYALIIMLVTAGYIIVGGMYSVILTDLIQYLLLAISAVTLAVIAYQKVDPSQLDVPGGWTQVFFGWHLDLDWSDTIPKLQEQIDKDHSHLFAIFVVAMFVKGVIVSMAGPSPSYGMQNVLATRSPKEAALESFWISVVAFFPRFLMIAAIVVLGLGPLRQDLLGLTEQSGSVDFEQLMPDVIRTFVPTGLKGLMVAGLLAAFMSTFDSTVNAASAYVVNDIYRRYFNSDASQRTYVVLGYAVSALVILAGIIFGYAAESVDAVTKFIVSGLFGAYAAPNLLRWHWWRLNGFGYFAGMVSGVAAALFFASVGSLAGVFPEAFSTAIAGMTRLQQFPVIFGISLAASVLASLATPPEPMSVLHSFYQSVRPWGAWQPVRQSLANSGVELEANLDMTRDLLNCGVGIVWQSSLVTLPIFLVLRHQTGIVGSIAVLVVTTCVLKVTWYDKLDTGDMYLVDEST